MSSCFIDSMPDDRLVQQHVVQHAAERVVRIVTPAASSTASLIASPRLPGVVRIGSQRIAAGLGVLLGLATTSAPHAADHRTAVRLLIVAHAHHVHLAFEAEHLTRQAQRASPLSGTRFGREPLDPGLLVIVGLGDRGVGLVAACRAHAFVFEVDLRRGVQFLLEAASPG